MSPLKEDTMNTDKTKLFIQKHAMLPEGSKVLCALSGGADSVCLLHFLSTLEGVEVCAAHYNHRLRGEESDRDEAFVRKLCADMGIICTAGGGNVAEYAAEKGMGIEEAAREMRYAFLEEAAEQTGCGYIATAHNADDNAETIIMNLARGTGLKGLCGIPPLRGNIIRPLLETSRAEIERYLSEHGLEHIEDSSNESDDYTRNRIRHHVLPVLREQNPSAVESIASAVESLREDEEYLSGLARKFIDESSEGRSLPVNQLLALPQSVMKRVIRLMHGGSLSAEHVRAIINICLVRSLHAHADVPGMRVTREFDRLIFASEEARAISRREIRPGEELHIPEAQLRISCREIRNAGEIHKSLTTLFFKSENICGRIFVASRTEGDRIALQGRNCTKSLKKLFSEAKLTLSDRKLTPVIYDEQGPIAVYGFGTAQRCAAEKGDDVIVIEIKKEEGETDE